VLTAAGAHEDLVIVRSDGSGYRQLTEDRYRDRLPMWSTDGRRILFKSDRSGRYELWTIHPDGSGLERVSAEPVPYFDSAVWASGDSRIVAVQGGPPHGLFLHDLQEDKAVWTAQPLPPSACGALMPTGSSSDGTQIVGFCLQSGKEVPGVWFYRPATREYGEIPGTRTLSLAEDIYLLADNRRLLVCGPSGITLFDTRTQDSHTLFGAPKPGQSITSCAISQDNRKIAYTETRQDGQIWLATLR
jgi:hypothetical protein